MAHSNLELLEREREFSNKKQNKSSSQISTDNAFKMPKKREIKEAEKKTEEYKSIGTKLCFLV